MIENIKQYNITKSCLKEFENVVLELKKMKNSPIRKLEIESIQNQMMDLKKEIDEYVALKSRMQIRKSDGKMFFGQSMKKPKSVKISTNISKSSVINTSDSA